MLPKEAAAAAPVVPPTIRGRAADRLLAVLFEYPTDGWEFASGFLALAWGVWVATFDDVFDRLIFSKFAETAAHAPFVEFVGENVVIGVAVAVVGLFALAVLFVPRLDALRPWASGALAAAWVSVAWGFGALDWQLTSTPIYGTFAALSTLAYARLSFTRRHFAHLRAEGLVDERGNPTGRRLANRAGDLVGTP